MVCSGGNEVSPGADKYCDAKIGCVSGACSASVYYLGCSGTDESCTETGKVYGTPWNAEYGETINETVNKS